MADESDVDTQPLAGAPSSWLVDGRYRIVERLGSGGTAEVFVAHDEVLGRDVAVKVFRTLADDPDGHTAQRRQLELESLAQLSHPNLITLYDGSVDSDGPPYLVLELVRGTDLAVRLHDGPLPEPEVRQIGAQIADALGYAHARGIVHRDVKPANILLGSAEVEGELRARLSDFGTVRLVHSAAVTASGLTLGTASYLAPEQARGADVGPEADVYALGLVLIEALTGERCFPGLEQEVLASRLTSSPEIPDGLPDPWPVLLAAMTAMEPEARPTAAEVAGSLRNVVSQPVLDDPSTFTDLAVERRGWLPWFIIAALAGLGLLASVAFLSSGSSGTGPASTPPVQPSLHHSTSLTHRPRESLAAAGPARSGPTASSSAPRLRHASATARPSASTSGVATPTASPSSSATTVSSSSSPAPSSSPPTDTTSALISPSP